MLYLLCIFIAAFVLNGLLTPLARSLASSWGLVDRPDARRKMHANPIPVAGGIAVLVTTCLVVGGIYLLPNPLQESLRNYPDFLLGLFLAALLLCVLGVLDDCQRLRGRQKLLGQIVAVGIVIAFDVEVHRIQIFDWSVELGILAIPFTAFWLIGAINSLNLLDGMDGLLGSVGAIISVAMALMAVLTGHWAAACVAMALAGGLAGFLRYNFPPATIFLGDAGSMVIGLVIGVLGIQGSLKSPATIALIAPLAVLTVPIFDTWAAVVRRKLTGQSIYTTDRGHLHHCLLRRGFSPWVTLLIISTFCLLTVVGALASLALKNENLAVCSILLVISILVLTRLFGHAEFLLIGKRLAQVLGSLMPGLDRRAHRHIEMRLQGTTRWKDLLDLVTAPELQLNLQTVCVDVNAPALHEEYHAKWDRSDKDSDEAHVWHADLPLAFKGHTVGRLKVAGNPDGASIANKIATLLRLIEEFEIDLPIPLRDVDAAEVPPHGLSKKKSNGHAAPEPVILALSVKLDLERQTSDISGRKLE